MSRRRNVPNNWGMLILFCFGVLLLGIGFAQQQNAFSLIARGIVTEGTVIEHRTSRSDDDTDYYLTYRFDAGLGDPPNIVTKEQSVNSTLYYENPVNSPVQVYFMPADPTNSMIFPHVRARDGQIAMAFGVLLGGGAGAWAFWRFRRRSAV